jgi:hypothetical protein
LTQLLVFCCTIAGFDISIAITTALSYYQIKPLIRSCFSDAVQKPREQIADAEALLGITTSLGASVRSHSALGITPSDLVAGLLKKFGTPADVYGEGASLRWRDVGLAASHVFMRVPGCCTM